MMNPSELQYLCRAVQLSQGRSTSFRYALHLAIGTIANARLHGVAVGCKTKLKYAYDVVGSIEYEEEAR